MKSTIISIIIAVVIIGGSIFLVSRNDADREGLSVNENNVSIVDSKQIIEITARGGYQPRKSVAKAGMPTIIRFNTNGTFDCSSAVRIPSLDISRNLPQRGTTDIDIGSPKLGILYGTCGMGMFPFEIDFQI